TINNVVAGQQFYVKVEAADSTTVFGTGTYGLSLNLGTGVSPTLPLPNTQVAAIYSGGGISSMMVSPPAPDDLEVAPGFWAALNTSKTETQLPAITTRREVAVDPHLNVAISLILEGANSDLSYGSRSWERAASSPGLRIHAEPGSANTFASMGLA